MSAGAVLLPFYPAGVRKQKKAVTVKSGQFFWGNRRNLAEERVERKISSPSTITGMTYLCNDRGQWAGRFCYWWWCYPIPFRERPNNRTAPQGLDQSAKVEEAEPKMARREAQMRDNLEGGLDPVEDVRRRCKNNSRYVLSCTGKRRLWP